MDVQRRLSDPFMRPPSPGSFEKMLHSKRGVNELQHAASSVDNGKGLTALLTITPRMTANSAPTSGGKEVEIELGPDGHSSI